MAWRWIMYTIMEVNCTGCGRCVEVCPSQAIILVDRKAQIVRDKCTACGRCLDVCKSNAVVVGTWSLQKTGSRTVEIDKAGERRLAAVPPRDKSQLWLKLCDLGLKVPDILVEHYAEPAQPSSAAKAARPRQGVTGGRGCQRRRRGRG